jgi:uncharacterized spore protein YtfJ
MAEAIMDAIVKDIINDVTEKIQKNARVKAVFGEPVEKGKITVIPVARVHVWGFGGGGLDELKDTEKRKAGGMGLGIKAKAVPVGYIEINSDEARFVEITEQKRILLWGIGLGAFTVFSLFRFFKKLLK